MPASETSRASWYVHGITMSGSSFLARDVCALQACVVLHIANIDEWSICRGIERHDFDILTSCIMCVNQYARSIKVLMLCQKYSTEHLLSRAEHKLRGCIT